MHGEIFNAPGQVKSDLAGIPVSVICKFDKDLIKMKVLSFPQHFFPYKSMGKIFDAHGRELHSEYSDLVGKWIRPRFYACPTRLAGSLTRFRWKIKATAQGWVTPKSDLAGFQTHLRFYACPSCLQIWWRSNQNRRLSLPQHFLHYKSVEKISTLKGE